MVIDAHAHIFPEIRGEAAMGPIRGLGYGRIAIGGKPHQLMPPLCEETRHTPEMLLAHMDWAGVDKAVLLQGPFYGECNAYVADAVRRFPTRLAGAAYFDPWADTQDSFISLCNQQVFRAVKLECSEAAGLVGLHPGASLDAVEFAWLWEELEQRALTLVLDLGAVGSASYQTDAVRLIAEDHPRLRIVIAHLAQPTPAVESNPARWQLWEQQIDLGRLFANVWFDKAALPVYSPQEAYPYPSAGRHLKAAIEHIGPAKVLWGTDLPGLLAHATYAQLLHFAEYHLQYLSESERRLVFGENAASVYGFT
jgi:predicted TIM-barrel fold metal-dependent hydrolase